MKKPEIPPQVNQIPTYSDIMSSLIKIGEFNEFFKIEDTEYPYWEEWKYKSKSWDISSEDIWSCAKFRRGGRRNIKISSVDGFDFQFNNPSIIQKLLHELDLNLGGSLQSESLIPNQEKDKYLVSSIMEEAIASSQIEGAVTTRKVAKEMLEKNHQPKNKSEQMILNNYNTMKWIVDNKQVKMSRDLLLEIHQSISNETLLSKEDEGRLRINDNVRIMDETNEVFYTPPQHIQLEQLINDFCLFANDENNNHVFVHPIVKGIILHFLIGYIHPFVDGNGRTARAVFYWYLIKKGYWLIEYMSVSRIILKSKVQYAKAYLHTEYDENDLTYFVLYNVKAITTALDDLKLYLEKKKDEKKQLFSLLKNTDFNERQIVLIQNILQDKNEYFTVKQIEKKFNVSNQTARNDLTDLIKKGILITNITGKKANFFAAENFDKKLLK